MACARAAAEYTASGWKVFEAGVTAELAMLDDILTARSATDARAHNKQLAQCDIAERSAAAHMDKVLQLHQVKRTVLAKQLINKFTAELVPAPQSTTRVGLRHHRIKLALRVPCNRRKCLQVPHALGN